MEKRVEFKRNIGLFMAVMIGIGAMMGPGIFALPGELAKMIGPIGILVYLAMGLMTVFTALNYSELGAAIPVAGGGYSFVSRTLAKPVAFFTGWFFGSATPWPVPCMPSFLPLLSELISYLE